MNEPVLYMPIGIPGSGKSTWAKDIGIPAENIHSSDQIRRDYEKAGLSYTNSDVFREMRKRTLADLRAGKPCIYDATNLTPRDRAAMLLHCPGNVRKVAVVFTTPLDVCLARNSKREGKARVPDNVILRMSQKVTLPTKEEGFDGIVTVPWNKDLEIRSDIEAIKKQHQQAISPHGARTNTHEREV